MKDGEFWTLVRSLKNDIDKASNVEDGIHNFFCHSNMLPYTAVSFIHTYEQKVREISSDRHYQHLCDDDGYFCGDDSWGDLCDSFPLHGQDVYEAFHKRTIDPNHDAFRDIPENYIRSRLSETVLPWLRDRNMDEDQAPDAVELLERELEDAKMLIRDLKGKLSKVQEIVS
jgi:hypothetical protein